MAVVVAVASIVTVVNVNAFYEPTQTISIILPDDKVEMQKSLDKMIEILEVQPEGEIRDELLDVLDSWKPRLTELGIVVPPPYDYSTTI